MLLQNLSICPEGLKKTTQTRLRCYLNDCYGNGLNLFDFILLVKSSDRSITCIMGFILIGQ